MAKKQTTKKTAKKTEKKTSGRKKAPAKKKAAPKKKPVDQSDPSIELDDEPETESKPAKKMSGTAAAAKLLAETGEPMNVGDITNTIIERGWWNPNGKTPDRTLYSAIITEIKKKGDDSRFRRAEERGKFEANV
jgi:hypothetical protein